MTDSNMLSPGGWNSSAMPFIPGLIYTCILMAVLPLASVFLKFNPIRRLVEKILPAGGTGPTREERSQGKFEFQLVATADTEPYDPVVRARGVVKGKKNEITFRATYRNGLST